MTVPAHRRTRRILPELLGDEVEMLRVYDDAIGRPIGKGSTLIGNLTIGIGRGFALAALLRVTHPTHAHEDSSMNILLGLEFVLVIGGGK